MAQWSWLLVSIEMVKGCLGIHPTWVPHGANLLVAAIYTSPLQRDVVRDCSREVVQRILASR